MRFYAHGDPMYLPPYASNITQLFFKAAIVQRQSSSLSKMLA